MRIKFLSLNIYNGHFLDECIEFLKKNDSDIFVLQEVYSRGSAVMDKKYRAFEILTDIFSDYYPSYSAEFFKIIDGVRVEAGNAVFSRFPILEERTVFVAGEYGERKQDNAHEFLTSGRNLQSVKLKAKGTELNIFNIHGVWGFDGKDNPERLKMSRTIVEEIKDKKNVILAGDFNLKPETVTIKNIEKYLDNVFGNTLKSTFNLKIKNEGVKRGFNNWKSKDLEGYAVSAVDMIFASPNIKVLSSRQPLVNVSDHYPLISLFEI